jgi:hypothetical protein
MYNYAKFARPYTSLAHHALKLGGNNGGFYTITLQETLMSCASLEDKLLNLAAMQQKLAISSIKASGHL